MSELMNSVLKPKTYSSQSVTYTNPYNKPLTTNTIIVQPAGNIKGYSRVHTQQTSSESNGMAGDKIGIIDYIEQGQPDYLIHNNCAEVLDKHSLSAHGWQALQKLKELISSGMAGKLVEDTEEKSDDATLKQARVNLAKVYEEHNLWKDSAGLIQTNYGNLYAHQKEFENILGYKYAPKYWVSITDHQIKHSMPGGLTDPLPEGVYGIKAIAQCTGNGEWVADFLNLSDFTLTRITCSRAGNNSWEKKYETLNPIDNSDQIKWQKYLNEMIGRTAYSFPSLSHEKGALQAVFDGYLNINNNANLEVYPAIRFIENILDCQ